MNRTAEGWQQMADHMQDDPPDCHVQVPVLRDAIADIQELAGEVKTGARLLAQATDRCRDTLGTALRRDMKRSLVERVAKELANITYPRNKWTEGFSPAAQEAWRETARQIIRMIRKVRPS